jgi:phosphoribosyl 1,2-cyclic phosphodiesterase
MSTWGCVGGTRRTYRLLIGETADSVAASSGMAVTFHGVRGSTPCHGDEIARYGGNTSCVSVEIPGHDPFLFDLGTGLRYFGLALSEGEPFRGTCLLTHLHWDHIQGLPFFKPVLHEGADVSIYAPWQVGDLSVEEIFADTIKPPLFPIHFSMFPGAVRFHEIGDHEFSIGDVRLMSRLVPHVGNTVGYRVTWNGRSVAYISDHQMPADGSFSATDGVLDLCRDVDLLIHDSQYTPDEFKQKSDWGHCTPEFAVWLAGEAGVKRLALFHHDPAHDDDMLDDLIGQAIECGRSLGVEVFAARERQTTFV